MKVWLKEFERGWAVFKEDAIGTGFEVEMSEEQFAMTQALDQAWKHMQDWLNLLFFDSLRRPPEAGI